VEQPVLLAACVVGQAAGKTDCPTTRRQTCLTPSDKLGVVDIKPENRNPELKSDLRREHRVKLEEAILISLLGPLAGPAIPGSMIDLSGSGLKVLSRRPLPCGSLVKVQGLNRLMLGEVLRSDPEGDSFSIGIKVKHVLDKPSDLEHLNPRVPIETPLG
jgi:hypothetical protein